MSAENSDAADVSPGEDLDTLDPVDEPIIVTTAEMVASIAILALMASAMGYIVWIVVRYWNQVGV